MQTSGISINLIHVSQLYHKLVDTQAFLILRGKHHLNHTWKCISKSKYDHTIIFEFCDNNNRYSNLTKMIISV